MKWKYAHEIKQHLNLSDFNLTEYLRNFPSNFATESLIDIIMQRYEVN